MTSRLANSRVAAFFIFAALSALLLLWLVPQLPPHPVYRIAVEDGLLDTDEGAPLIRLESGQPYEVVFPAPKAGINALVLQYLFTDGSKGSYLKAVVENRTRGTLLAEANLTFGHLIQMDFAPDNEVGDQIALSVEVGQSIKGENPAVLQGIKRAFYQPTIELTPSIGGERTADPLLSRPLFTLKYHQPAKGLLWLWPLFLGGFAFLYLSRFHDLPHRLLFYLPLALLIVATSLLLFSQRLYQQWDFIDPDSYGNYMEALLKWIQNPDARPEAAAWIRDYAHAQVPLTPILLALLNLIGIPMIAAYPWLAGISAFGILLIVDWIAKRQLDLTPRSTLLTVVLLATHLVFLKSFARPSTDMPGLVLTVAALSLICQRYFVRFTWQQNLWFAGLLCLICLSRPPGIAYGFLLGIAALGADAARRHGLLAPGLLRHSLQIAVPAGIILALLYFKFDWFHNLEINVEKSKEFHKDSTLARFIPSFITIFAPLLLLLPWHWRRSHFPTHLQWGWVTSVLLLLCLLKAPFTLRLFLPVLPSVALLAGSALNRRKNAFLPLAFALVLIITNLALLYHEWVQPLFPAEKLVNFIYY